MNFQPWFHLARHMVDQGQLSLQLFQRCLQVAPPSWKSFAVSVSLDVSLSTRWWGLVGSTWALPAMSLLHIPCEYRGPSFWTWTWTSKRSMSQLHGQSAYFDLLYFIIHNHCLRWRFMGLYLKYDRCPNHPIGILCWSILHSSPHQLQKRFAGIAKPCNSRLVGPKIPWNEESVNIAGVPWHPWVFDHQDGVPEKSSVAIGAVRWFSLSTSHLLAVWRLSGVCFNSVERKRRVSDPTAEDELHPVSIRAQAFVWWPKMEKCMQRSNHEMVFVSHYHLHSWNLGRSAWDLRSRVQAMACFGHRNAWEFWIAKPHTECLRIFSSPFQ